jgi:ferric-dicitrate binding protein FerR (iron transport regulator)
MQDLEKKINERLSQYEPPFSDRNAVSAKASVMSRTVNAENSDSGLVRYISMHAAAAIVIVILSLPFVIHFLGKKELNYGQVRSFKLPDNSKVELMPGSNMSYNSLSWWFDRSVKLRGEALFTVEKGEKFTVNTTYQDEVTVLGTVFSVKTDSSGLLVHCREGEVRIADRLLGEGEYLYKDQNRIIKGKTRKSDQTITSLSKTLEFDRQPLSWVVAALEEKYDLDIKLNIEGEYEFSGKLDRESSENSLVQLCNSLGLEFEDNHQVVVIFEP